MQAIFRQPQQALDCAPLHYERHRPEQTAQYLLVQQRATSNGSELLRFFMDEFDAFLECSILASGVLRLRRGEWGHEELLAFNCKRLGFCPVARPAADDAERGTPARQTPMPTGRRHTPSEGDQPHSTRH